MRKTLVIGLLTVATQLSAGPFGQDDTKSPQYAAGGTIASKTDQDIMKKVESEVGSGVFSSGYPNVTYEVKSGVVSLNGTVDKLENKAKLEDNIKKIDGVQQVNSQLKVAPTTKSAYSESQLKDSEMKYPKDSAATSQDRQLNATIRNKTAGFFTKLNDTVAFKTTNGIVMITGFVDKSDDVMKLGDQVKGIEGVKSVDNQLQVKEIVSVKSADNQLKVTVTKTS